MVVTRYVLPWQTWIGVSYYTLAEDIYEISTSKMCWQPTFVRVQLIFII